jgi:hypothetical protein
MSPAAWDRDARAIKMVPASAKVRHRESNIVAPP